LPAFLYKKQDGTFRVNLDLYYPPFRERIFEAKAKAAERGCWMYALRGFATWAEQHQLRMKYLNGTGGKAAPAGYSAHNYGLAEDSAADSDIATPGLQPTWDPKRYDIYGEELARVGLVWGASFGDRPHAQWPGFVSGTQIQVLKGIWDACPKGTADPKRLEAIWAYVDSLPAPPRG
jgi:peptidoglycan L-alanyl-D-glutamate endopeptidase CwlK